MLSCTYNIFLPYNSVLVLPHEDISKKDLPQEIVKKIAKDFGSYKIDDTDKIEADGKVVYLVELDGAADDRKVTFTATGDVQENIAD